jgi:hypothetical protein
MNFRVFLIQRTVTGITLIAAAAAADEDIFPLPTTAWSDTAIDLRQRLPQSSSSSPDVEHQQDHTAADKCSFEVNVVYGVVSSCVSFWTPAVVIVFAYVKIFREARRQQARIRSQTTSSSSTSLTQHHNHQHHHQHSQLRDHSAKHLTTAATPYATSDDGLLAASINGSSSTGHRPGERHTKHYELIYSAGATRKISGGTLKIMRKLNLIYNASVRARTHAVVVIAQSLSQQSKARKI